MQRSAWQDSTRKTVKSPRNSVAWAVNKLSDGLDEDSSPSLEQAAEEARTELVNLLDHDDFQDDE